MNTTNLPLEEMTTCDTVRFDRQLEAIKTTLGKIERLTPAEYLAWRLDATADSAVRHCVGDIGKREKQAAEFSARVKGGYGVGSLLAGGSCFPISATRAIVRVSKKLERLMSIAEKDEVPALIDISAVRSKHKDLMLEMIEEIKIELAGVLVPSEKAAIGLSAKAVGIGVVDIGDAMIDELSVLADAVNDTAKKVRPHRQKLCMRWLEATEGNNEGVDLTWKNVQERYRGCGDFISAVAAHVQAVNSFEELVMKSQHKTS
jgi:DNA-binding FrmR family transcriptional regulator